MAATVLPQSRTASTVVEVTDWVRAVLAHTPGEKDHAVQFVLEWSADRRKFLDPGLGLLLSALVGKPVVVTSEEDKAIADLGRSTAQTAGASVFLERAAVLHADAVMLAPVASSTAANPTASSASSPSRFGTVELLRAADASIAGAATSDWNWTFARSLIDLIAPKPRDEPFVAVWYHSTTAYLFQQRRWGEARGHLNRAAALLPDDARILFHRACLSETMGLPESQRLLSEEDLAALRIRSVPGQRVSAGTPRVTSEAARSGVRPVEVENAEAEQLYRQALRTDRGLIEAHVRLTRLLEVRGKHADAEAESNAALGSSDIDSDPVLVYYARLFAARAAQALGRHEAALADLQAALALFPSAQSALLARSELAFLNSDVSEALASLRPLSEPPLGEVRQDPWWVYDTCLGRNADRFLQEMWSKARVLGK